MIARIEIEGSDFLADLSHPVSLALEVDFSGHGPRHFGAPRPISEPLVAPGFPGLVTAGASCNCCTITLTPHCNGTHTECVGHLTHEKLDAHRIAPAGLLPARVVSVEPILAARANAEGSDPAPHSDDLVVTRAMLEDACRDSPSAHAHSPPFVPRALIIRTLPNDTGKQHRDYTGETPPYLTREAAGFLVDHGIEHVVVDLPSLDRARDEGRLTAHRVFFGLSADAAHARQAARAQCTITELAFVPDPISDGWYLLQLQVPAIAGDAVPSRPLVYPVK